jgi:hypothetical protein
MSDYRKPEHTFGTTTYFGKDIRTQIKKCKMVVVNVMGTEIAAKISKEEAYSILDKCAHFLSLTVNESGFATLQKSAYYNY